MSSAAQQGGPGRNQARARALACASGIARPAAQAVAKRLSPNWARTAASARCESAPKTGGMGAPMAAQGCPERLSRSSQSSSPHSRALPRGHLGQPDQPASGTSTHASVIRPRASRPAELTRAGVTFRKDDNGFLAVVDVATLEAAAERLTAALAQAAM